MIHITRRVTFCAAHKLARENWSKEKNETIFGQCSNPNWHGHNFQLFVTIKGEINKDTGFLINLQDLNQLLEEKIIKKVDHKNINLDVDFMKDKLASIEVLIVEFWKQIDSPLKKLGAQLHSLRLLESENNSVEYFGN